MAVGFFRALAVSSMVVLSALSATAGDDPPPGDSPPPRVGPVIPPIRPNLLMWLEAHPKIASAIKWQVAGSGWQGDGETPDYWRLSFPDWSSDEKQELVQAFNDTWNWYYGQAQPFANLQENIAYPFPNNLVLLHDEDHPWTFIDRPTAWAFFLSWVAEQLVAEIGGHFPWSILDYDDASLQVLFDSMAMS